MSFYHQFNFTTTMNDGGGLYLYDGSDWINPLNDHQTAVSGDPYVFGIVAGLAYPGHPAENGWIHDSGGEWVLVTVNLSAIGISTSNFSFSFVFGETGVDPGHGFGWFIDDIVITAEYQAKSNPGGVDWWWFIVIGGVIAAIVTGIGISTHGRGDRFNRDGGEITGPGATDVTPTVPGETGGSGTTDTTGGTTDITGGTSDPGAGGDGSNPPASRPASVPAGVPVKQERPPQVRWKRSADDTETENPLHPRGYRYNIYFEVPCTITPGPNEVIVAHIVITITASCDPAKCTNNPNCSNGTFTQTYDYWEAFTMVDPPKDKSTALDKHYVDMADVEKRLRIAGCPNPDKIKIDRKHTVNRGEVTGADWTERLEGGSFAYILHGPPPQSAMSNPSSRPGEGMNVRGSVTLFSEDGALVFTSSYTYEASTGNQSFQSTMNPGNTYN